MVTSVKVENVWEEDLFPHDYRVETCANTQYLRVIVPWNRRHQDYISWCEQNFGPRPVSVSQVPVRLRARWYSGIDCFYFREEPDVVLFMLKFGGQ